jgi:hypothetical protein
MFVSGSNTETSSHPIEAQNTYWAVACYVCGKDNRPNPKSECIQYCLIRPWSRNEALRINFR